MVQFATPKRNLTSTGWEPRNDPAGTGKKYQMIKAAFFDFYNTLVRFWPPVDVIQQASCREMGFRVSKVGIRKGYFLADDYMSRENADSPLADRSSGERDRFFAEYERIILKGAGLEVTIRLAAQIWEMASQVPKNFSLFEDVIPALELLKKRDITLGVSSNLRRDMGYLSKELSLDPYLDFYVTAVEAGAEKPHPPVFLAALKKAGVDASEAVHVGDQYQADVQGARAAGIVPVLLDREGWYTDVNDCSKINSLSELDGLLAQGLL